MARGLALPADGPVGPPAGVSALVPAWVFDALPELLRRAPVPPTVGAFEEGRWFRPPGHRRSVYLKAPEGNDVLAVKGLEPLIPDFPSLLDDLRDEFYVFIAIEPRRAAEHFAAIERKVPGALSLDEAEQEADKARILHEAHATHYGELARVPVPLAVLHLDDTVSRRVERQLSGRLSGPAREAIVPALRHGLAVSLSWYPGRPTRTTALNYALPDASYHRRAMELAALLDPAEVIRRWTTLFARIMHLGHAPASLAGSRTGNLCQAQNTALNGGFFDVDSLTPLAGLHGPGAVADALQWSLRSLGHAVRTLLVERSNHHSPTRGDAVDTWIERALVSAVRHALVTEARPSLDLDDRVEGYFAADLGIDALQEHLAAYFPDRSLQGRRSAYGDWFARNTWLLRDAEAPPSG